MIVFLNENVGGQNGAVRQAGRVEEMKQFKDAPPKPDCRTRGDSVRVKLHHRLERMPKAIFTAKDAHFLTGKEARRDLSMHDRLRQQSAKNICARGRTLLERL